MIKLSKIVKKIQVSSPLILRSGRIDMLSIGLLLVSAVNRKYRRLAELGLLAVQGLWFVRGLWPAAWNRGLLHVKATTLLVKTGTLRACDDLLHVKAGTRRYTWTAADALAEAQTLNREFCRVIDARIHELNSWFKTAVR